jgi:hypothetical protein
MRDTDVRQAVRGYLSDLHKDDETTKVVEEMGLWAGTVRIDIAVINGELTGFELKSDRDTLERLPAQADIYSRVFDRVTLVAGARHLDKSMALIPDWWGVVCAEWCNGRVELRPVRAETLNPSIEAYFVAELLWKEEAVSMLEEYGLAKGWRSKPIREIHMRLASELVIDDLRDGVRQALKSRGPRLRQTVSSQRQVSI